MMPKIPMLVMGTLSHVGYSDGHYDYDNGGEWVDGNIVTTAFKGCVMPMSYQDMRYDTGGTYANDDRKLYTYQSFKTGEKIIHEGIEYAIQQNKDYSQFGGGLHIYILKRGDNQ
ncbi:hypothetical protein LNN31_13605 [Acetobacterium wieringae]|uniref:Uncharacterized protein n=1 Tax=Acetobacterium wieringae TaxID=52694 RepID=A0ABY6HBF2_9FIRM|nr:hypothetical protein [Acetobacterium wieringae]UYO61812.1 hypothetical protein LNN31_13605 [Acetobacterium wieringae]